MMFRNGAEYGGLYPEDDRPRWRFCAPRLDWGDDALHPIRATLLDRAAALGYAFEEDPELHLIVDGETVQPLSEVDGVYRFEVPAGGETVWTRLAERRTGRNRAQLGRPAPARRRGRADPAARRRAVGRGLARPWGA